MYIAHLWKGGTIIESISLAIKIFKIIIQGYKALCAWHVYNGQLLNPKELHNNKNIFINFSEFINNPTAMNELQDFIGIPLVDCRNKKMYRAIPVRDKYYNICAALLSRDRKPHVEAL